MPRNIFIGGTGRSGTTVLAKTLGNIPEIYTFPRELRFHVDPNGLSQLWRAGTQSYNPPASAATLGAFVQLMVDYLATPGRHPYRGFDFPKFFGKELYFSELSGLLEKVCLDKYKGFHLHADPLHQIPNSPRLLRGASRHAIRAFGRVFDRAVSTSMRSHGYEYTSEIYEMRHFEDAESFARLLGRFFERLADYKVSENGARVFCEHTPGNGCESRFIANAFPDSCLVWISRNPADVALSYRDQVWAPTNLEAICELLKAQHSVWARDKIELDRMNYKYIEVRIEDLTEDPTGVLADILDLADLQVQLPDLSHLERKRHAGNRAMTARETEIVRSYFPGAL